MTSDDGTSQGGTAGDGTGGTSASGGVGAGGTGGFGATGGFGGNPPGFGGAGGFATGGFGGSGGGPITCPETRPLSWQAGSCQLPAGFRCTYDVACQSGMVSFEYECINGFFQLVPNACRLPADSCPGTGLYCQQDGQWYDFHAGTNPPSPCPVERPQNGATCLTSGFGGYLSPCGYYCPDGAWALSSCAQADGGPSYWMDGPGAACATRDL